MTEGLVGSDKIGFQETGEIENFLIISMKLLQMKKYKLVSLGFSILGKALNFWRIETVSLTRRSK